MAELSIGLLGFVLTLMLHASVLLGAVWVMERVGVLKHPRWAEIAWRGALFGSLLTAGLAAWAPAWRTAETMTPAERHESGATSEIAATSLAPLASMTEATDVGDATQATLRGDGAPRRTLRGAADGGGGAGAASSHGLAGDADATASSASDATISARDDAVGARVPASRGVALELPGEVIAIAARAWLALTLAWLLLTSWRVAGVARLLLRARRAPRADATQQSQANVLAHALHLAPPHLHLQHALASPIALPARTVLLPPWSRSLPESESRALLAHELAHLQRNDPWWRIAQHLALAPLALHPLAWLALRRLDALAERQADATAARLLGDGRPLAECLARCLAQQAEELTSRPATPRFALAMAERPGAVVDRVQRLLEEDPMQHIDPSPRRTRLAIALGLAAALFLPGLAVLSIGESLASGQSISIQSDDGHESVRIRSRDGTGSLEVDMQGKVTFADDESDVLAMDDDAELEIEETRDGVTRSIEFSGSAEGIARDYRVEGSSHPFDADARTWLARVLPDLFRSSGIQAEARVERILARGGTDALLTEIDLIRSDYGRGRYLGLLYAKATLTPTQQSRALELTRAIDSDYELRQALGMALESRTLTREQQLQVLDLAGEIGSDYERAELLVQTAGTFTLDAPSFERWSTALEGISSDYESRRVLEALLERADENPAAVKLAFEAAARIGSDYEKRQLLEAGITHARADAALRAEYLRVASDIGSDYERKEALLALLRGGEVDTSIALQTLDAIDGIGSDHETKEALVALAQVMPAEGAVIDRYRASARRLGTHERGEAEQALDRMVVVK